MASILPAQTTALAIIERTMSCLSLFGIMVVFSLFGLSKNFRKPINRQIFYACFGNLGMNIATLVSEAGVAAGQDSVLCQLQGFFIQMFLGVDAFWALCMACNVYLAFFKGYSVLQLKSLDMVYLSICYGLALIPAIIYIFLSTESRGRVYGPATLWCWIDVKWDFLRIATLYGIVWFAILTSQIIYCFAAQLIYKKRSQLEGYLNPFNENPFTVTWEVTVTTEERTTDDIVHDPTKEVDTHGARGYRPYDVEIRGERNLSHQASAAEFFNIANISRQVARKEPNAEAWLYARVAFLFFISILITWVPSSANRIYSLVYPDSINYPLNVASSIVLPLQGFWNMCVFLITSQTACKQLWKDIRAYNFSSSRKPSTSTDTSNDIPLARMQRRHRQRLGSESQSSLNREQTEPHP